MIIPCGFLTFFSLTQHALDTELIKKDRQFILKQIKLIVDKEEQEANENNK